MSERKLKNSGTTSEVSLDKTKNYKYDKSGALVEATTVGDNDIVFSGSKSSLRRLSDLERNVSILAATLTTTDGGVTDAQDDTFAGIFTTAQRFKGTVQIDGAATFASDVAMSSKKITGLGTPTATADASTKGYVDSTVATEVTARNSAIATAKSEATSAAATDAASKVAAEATARDTAIATAKSQAISAAATDATTKANSAQSNAASDATTKVAAEATARDTAIATAKAAAIASAATDATTKVAAEATARDTAIATAKSAALSTAATDATTKVAAEATARDTAIAAEATARDTAIATAKAAAIASAATDATTKANAAQAAAIASAATDATTKANAASAAAIAAVTNGAGAAFDTLVEIQNAMATDAELASAIAAISNVATATKLQTARAIQGVAFDGSAAITVVTAGTGISVVGTAVANTGVLSVSGTAPVVSSGGASPAISMAAATSLANGYMTSTYAAKLDGIAAGATNVSNTNQLTNGAGFITGISSANVTTALGFTPYNSTNPSGYIVASSNTSGTHTGAVSTVSACSTGALAVSGGITATGEITAYYSDVNLKKDIVEITDPIAKVMSLRGVTFRPNQTALDLGIIDKEEVGVIAQEVEAVLPQLVTPSAFKGFKTVKYDKLTALLLEAVKAQQLQIDALRAEISKLGGSATTEL